MKNTTVGGDMNFRFCVVLGGAVDGVDLLNISNRMGSSKIKD